jgi:hypothetical protein
MPFKKNPVIPWRGQKSGRLYKNVMPMEMGNHAM